MCTYSLDPNYLTSAHHAKASNPKTQLQNLSCHQIDKLSPLAPKGGIIVCAEMGDVHLFRDLAHLLDQTAKVLALDRFRHGVDNGTKLGTIAVRDIGEQLGPFPFLESSVGSFEHNG